MSEEQLKAFLVKVGANASLRQQLQSAMHDDVVKLAEDHGFVITKADMPSLSRDLADEINDEDLEMMNAGSFGSVFTDLKRSTTFRELFRDIKIGLWPFPTSAMRGC